MWPIKLLGALMVVLSASAVGFNMSKRLKKRAKTLKSFLVSIDSISVYIRLSNFEINEILERCLPCGMTYDGTGLIAENFLCLKEDDLQLINEFLNDLGMTDTHCLLNRCKSYKQLFLNQIGEADREISEKYRLYSVSGVLVGITLSFLWW